MRGFAQHLYTLINFSDLREQIVLARGFCASGMSTWRRHLRCVIVQPLSAVCLAVCGIALSPPGNERRAPA